MKVHVECYPDVFLVKSMGFSPLHAKGKGRAINEGKKGSVCIVDFDSEESMRDYISGCTEDKELSEQNLGIRVYRSKGIIIALVKKLEDFIIKSAREAGISLRNYGLSDDERELHSQISKRKPPAEFINLLRELGERSRRMKKLREIISTVMENCKL